MDKAGAGTILPTLLVLIDEVTRDRSLRDDAALIACLRAQADVVAVAPCYLRSARRLRQLKCPFQTYAFATAGYDEAVYGFAEHLRGTCAPHWVLCVGASNAQLVAAFDSLSVPVVALVPSPPGDAAACGRLYEIVRRADGIILGAGVEAHDLGAAAGSLEARDDRRVHRLAATEPRSVGRLGQLGRLLPRRGRPRRDPQAEAHAGLTFGKALAAKNLAADHQTQQDRRAILQSGIFDMQLAGTGAGNRLDAYLRTSAKTRPYANMFAGRLVRRPAIGFNPLIYATDAPDFDKAGLEDPLAHFLRSGRTAGRWTHEALQVAAPEIVGPAQAPPLSGLPRAALHLHLHYPEALPDFLSRFRRNRCAGVDLHITTTSADAASKIEKSLGGDAQTARLHVRKNLGRDVWPFLDLLQAGIFDDYGIVGHLHGKRSPHFSHGDIWRRFLWDHLVGDERPVMDVIRRAFAADSNLGLVFPEEPHLGGWDQNLPIATDLARRMGIDVPLPIYFEYPMGTMFWARPQALAPLVRLHLREADMPGEPVPVDGTILHAIECLLVFIVQQAGFSFRTTYVKGSYR